MLHCQYYVRFAFCFKKQCMPYIVLYHLCLTVSTMCGFTIDAFSIILFCYTSCLYFTSCTSWHTSHHIQNSLKQNKLQSLTKVLLTWWSFGPAPYKLLPVRIFFFVGLNFFRQFHTFNEFITCQLLSSRKGTC